MSKRVLAFDFGASNGRALLGTYEDGKLNLKELHRFSNDPVNIRGTLYWDVLRLFHEIKTGITKAVLDGGFDSIGIDTWAVDFGLLDKNGELLQNPVHYRDERTADMMEKTFAIVPKDEIYDRTGIQFLRLNTLYQLMSLVQTRPELLERTDTMLLIPDLFNYFLTGEKAAEYTNVSTTQLMDPRDGSWCRDLCEKLGIPTGMLPGIVDAGSIVGNLSADICEELGVKNAAPVIAVASHDTGSAVAAVPTAEKDFVYISCGTWSLFGTELDRPCINEKTAAYNLTNEGGVGRTTRLLKNIIGLWLIQESRRQWQREGANVSFQDLEDEAREAKPLQCFINPDAPEFELPGNLPKHVQEFCRRTGQYVPQNRAEIMRCIYESLAFKHRRTLEMMRDVTGKDYHVIHMIGGGTKDKFLCQLTANACGTTVVVGPTEATAIGNVAVQMMTLGEFGSLAEARAAIARSIDTVRMEPDAADRAVWEEAYQRCLKIFEA